MTSTTTQYVRVAHHYTTRIEPIKPCIIFVFINVFNSIEMERKYLEVVASDNRKERKKASS